MNDKSAVSMVQERWNVADRGREEYAAQAVENEKLYRAYIDETSHPYLSNICLPWPYIIVESYLGKCIQILASMLPYVRVVEEDDDSRQKAKIVEKDANMCLYLQKWPILAYKLYKQAFKYPCGWLEIDPWGTVGEREMPIFKVRNWFNTWVNPTITELDDPDAFIVAIDYVPAWILKEYANNPYYKNINRIKTHEGEIYTNEEQEVRSFKTIPSRENDPYSELVKVTRYWSYRDFIVTTNDTNIIRNDGENFLGSLPFKCITPIPLDDELYGMSILEEGKGLFDEMNENENQFNDAVNLMLNPQWIISRGADVKRSTIVAKSGGILFTDDVNGIVPMKIDWNILTAALQRKSRIEGDIQNYSNAFPQMRGQSVSGTDTATEYVGMKQAGELRADTYNLLLSMMSVEDMVRDIVKYKKMFMTSPNGFYYWPEQQPVTATPEDYAGNFTFKAVSQYKMSREIERKQFIEAMALVWGNQAFLPMIGPKADEWLSRLLDYFGIRDSQQLFSNPQEEQMMNMMMQAMGAQGGNGSAPALGEREMRMPELSPNTEMANIIPRAEGGFVNYGQPYLVGEKGPEIMVPNRGGFVIPNEQVDRSKWDLRQDGTQKGTGWLGVLPNSSGGVSSEITAGVNLGGKEHLIPTMVPTLDENEINYLLSVPQNPEMFKTPTGKRILDKAVEHAKERLRMGLSPFKD